METWTLQHPTYGLIEVERGYDAEFLVRDPEWPGRPLGFGDSDGDGKDPGEMKTGTDPGPDAPLTERVRAFVDNPSVRLQIKVDGQVRRQLNDVPSGKVPLERKVGEELSAATSTPVVTGKPHLYIRSNFFDEVLVVEYRNGKEVVEFTPPAGSRGEKRHRAMEESSFKRVLYPMLGGLGKSGWAIAVIVLGPVVSRLLDWLLQFFPDWDLPTMPPLPDITLPVPSLPSIVLPVPDWPDWSISLPHFTAPGWLLFLMDYTKVWVPLVAAIVFGILALRNHRRSEEQKRRWQQQQLVAAPHDEEESQDADPRAHS